jgi:hypothetical protein
MLLIERSEVIGRMTAYPEVNRATVTLGFFRIEDKPT